MTTKIWVVKASSGQYDDYCSWNVKAFYTKESAENYVSSQPLINHGALYELDQLIYDQTVEFTEGLNYKVPKTDEEWDIHESKLSDLETEAREKIQMKYPDADLYIDPDFNGYSIESLELED